MVRTAYKTIPLLTILGIAGCSTHAPEPFDAAADFHDVSIYLRGDMSGWQALREYRLQRVSPHLYSVAGRLRHTYGTYKFKFADAEWTCGYNYGAADGGHAQLQAGNKVAVTPCNTYGELAFTPSSDGVYHFYLDLRGASPQVFVQPH